jgi:hypothetical protein
VLLIGRPMGWLVLALPHLDIGSTVGPVSKVVAQPRAADNASVLVQGVNQDGWQLPVLVRIDQDDYWGR